MTRNDRSPESAARFIAHQCRQPVDMWDESDRERIRSDLETLADADLYPDHAAGLRDRLEAWAEGDRDDLRDDLREYAIEASDCLGARADEQAGGWRAEYETTRHRGPDRYPVPDDWTLGIVEADGSGWRRPERPDDAPRGWTYDDNAGTLNEWDTETDETTVTFSVNGETVFEVTEPDRDDLMASIAEVLARVARGEEYDDVDAPEDYGGEGRNEQSASLTEFGGGQ